MWAWILAAAAAVLGYRVLTERASAAPRPSPRPGPQPEPVPARCDPLDASTWPPGKLCVHDGASFVLVDADADEPDHPMPEPGPSGETQCALVVLNDHADIIDRAHLGVADESQAQLLAAAVVHDKNGAFVRLGRGYASGWHEHGVALNAAQIDALRAGATVEALTSHDNGHRHLVRVRCSYVRPPL